MTDRTNEDRAETAAEALDAYARLCYFHPAGEPTGAAVGDLLADLRHLCDRHGIDFDQMVTRSAVNYDAEIHGDGFIEGEPPNSGGDPKQQWPRDAWAAWVHYMDAQDQRDGNTR